MNKIGAAVRIDERELHISLHDTTENSRNELYQQLAPILSHWLGDYERRIKEEQEILSMKEARA